MTKLDEWLQDPEYAKLFNQEGFLMDFWEGLLEQMEITPADLAANAGLAPEELRQYMAGEREFTLRQTVEMCDAAGCTISLQIKKKPT